MATADGYKHYTQAHEYSHTPGVVIAPSSNRNGSARLIRLGCAYGTRNVAFDAMRAGMPPILPSAVDTDNDTLVSATVTLPLPTADTRNAGYTFRGAGRYSYLQNTVRIPGTDPLPTGAYPFATEADFVASGRLQSDPGYAAAVTDPTDPNGALIALAGVQFDDDNPQYGWHLTGYPSQAFTLYSILG